MKVLLIIFSINEQILHIKKNLQSLGCEVECIYSDSYQQVCPYYMKKLDKIGIHIGRDRYLESIRIYLHKLMTEFCPEIVLFVNTPKNVMDVSDINYIKQRAKTVCWFVDGIADHQEILGYLNTFDKIYVFEHSDIAYLNSMNLEATYLPVGYNEAFSNIKPQKRDIDILFIGSPFHNRLKILEQVAIESSKRGWRLKIIGPFYDKKYPWKKIIFQKKYPYIYRYLENKRVSSDVAAKLYSRTKICLNIHDTKHKSPNPRTFEILAVGAFELIDIRDYWGALKPDYDLVTFANSSDLIRKIDMYLKNDYKRYQIALNGNKTIKSVFAMRNLLATMITDR